MKEKINLRNILSAGDSSSFAREINRSWKDKSGIYAWLKQENKRRNKMKWKQPYIQLSIVILCFALICSFVSFYIDKDAQNGTDAWAANMLQSLGTGLFGGWSLYVLSNFRMQYEEKISKKLEIVRALYELGKKVYDIEMFYITYHVVPKYMREEWDHNEAFSNAIIAANDLSIKWRSWAHVRF